jgi:hypothetical protein
MVSLLLLAFVFVASPASSLVVEDGLYSRLTVQVTEAVPRQMCHRAINNLQVREKSQSNLCMLLIFGHAL